MGWSIKVNKNKWSIFSSITDSIIASFDKKQDCVKFIAKEQMYEGKKKAIETLMTFPDNWTVNDKICLPDNRIELLDKYYKWINSIYNLKTYEEYYEAIDNKLNELMEK